MFSGRRSARSGPGVLGTMPASGATGDGLIGSAIAKTRSSISGNIPVLPEQIPVAAILGGHSCQLNRTLNRPSVPPFHVIFIVRHPERSEGARKLRTSSELREVPRRQRGSG